MLGQAENATARRERCLRHHEPMERVVLGEPGPQQQPEHAPPAEGAPEGPDAPSAEAKAREKRFLIGTAISVYQNSGDPASQWDHFQGRRVLGGLLPSIMNGDRVGKSTDFWDRHAVFLASAGFVKLLPHNDLVRVLLPGKAVSLALCYAACYMPTLLCNAIPMPWLRNRYEDDLKLARSLGSNAFRFSLEWSRVEPIRGQICAPALLRYHKMIDCMIRCAQQLRH